MPKSLFSVQLAVFALVAAAFTNIYLTQPILPVLQDEFQVSTVQVSFTVSGVILGIVMANLIFGALADRYPIRPILLVGGICVAAGACVAAWTHDFRVLVGARIFQGLFIPALTTSLAAWLARTLSRDRLGQVMGAYVSATVLGGLGGRLLGGFIHPPLHWRYAMVSAGALILATLALALVLLPGREKQEQKGEGKTSFRALAGRRELWPAFACGAVGLLMFSPVFNYLPYRLSGPPFGFSTQVVTLIYLVYVVGIFLGPLAGGMAQRHGYGKAMMAGTLVMGCSLTALLLPWTWAVVLGLLGICTGFFTIHTVSVGLLNQKLTRGHGKANAIYVLVYYAGGWVGITGAGLAFQSWGWSGVIAFVLSFLAIPLVTGWWELKKVEN
ncbi:MAG: MFS transporter [Desulfobacterales bacterium]|nr:MFS transporter [Desulfobacterales bacterium]